MGVLLIASNSTVTNAYHHAIHKCTMPYNIVLEMFVSRLVVGAVSKSTSGTHGRLSNGQLTETVTLKRFHIISKKVSPETSRHTMMACRYPYKVPFSFCYNRGPPLRIVPQKIPHSINFLFTFNLWGKTLPCICFLYPAFHSLAWHHGNSPTGRHLGKRTSSESDTGVPPNWIKEGYFFMMTVKTSNQHGNQKNIQQSTTTKKKDPLHCHY